MLSTLAPTKIKIPQRAKDFDQKSLVQESQRKIYEQLHRLLPNDPLSVVLMYCEPLITELEGINYTGSIAIQWHDDRYVLLKFYAFDLPDIITAYRKLTLYKT